MSKISQLKTKTNITRRFLSVSPVNYRQVRSERRPVVRMVKILIKIASGM